MTEEEWQAEVLAKINDISNRLNAIHQGLYGVPDTDDKGFCGRVNAVEAKLEIQRNRLTLLIGLLIGAGVLGGAAGATLTRLIGG